MAFAKMPSVSLSLNVPGFPKSNPVTLQFFNLCLEDLNYFLQANRLSIDLACALQQTDGAGNFFIAPVLATPLSITDMKKVCETFEERHPLGRFVDVDLTDGEGNPVSSGKAKPCFFCHQKPADVCRHENAHDLNELRSFMFSEMEAFCYRRRENRLCRKISSLALKAILYEISLTPKPGLVDKFSNGSHADMNFRPSSILPLLFRPILPIWFVKDLPSLQMTLRKPCPLFGIRVYEWKMPCLPLHKM